MHLELLRENCIFAWLPELECAWGAVSILTGEKKHTLCTEIYGTEQISAWKRRYSFLFETFRAADPCCMLDYLLDMPLESVTLESLKNHILSQPPAEFVWRQLNPGYFCKTASLETLRLALTDDNALDEAYSWVSERCDSFLAFAAFVRQCPRLISDFFALAEEMRTPALTAALEKQAPKVERMCQTIRDGAQSADPLALSQTLMGKTFHNRGPYDTFVFLPSFLLPMQACRFFHTEGPAKRQLLFLTLRQTRRSQEDTVKALKAMADPTRYQILTILAREGPMRGLDIAKKVSIATSTVSHHMEQMKESGLITEEPVKNAKYYGLSKQAAQTLLEEIAKDLAIEP